MDARHAVHVLGDEAVRGDDDQEVLDDARHGVEDVEEEHGQADDLDERVGPADGELLVLGAGIPDSAQGRGVGI